MVINSFQIEKSLQLIPLSKEQTIGVVKSNKKQIWVDLKEFEIDELKQWFDNLDVKNLTRQLLKKGSHRTGFYPFNAELLMIVPVIIDSGEEGTLAILCRDHLLLTIHRKNVSCLNREEWEQDDNELLFYGESTSALLSAILMDLSLDVTDKVNELRDVVEQMEKKFEKNPSSLEMKEIMKARTQQLFIESIIFGQSPCIAGLKAVDKPFFNIAEAKDYLNCSEVNLLAAKNLLDRLENRILDLRSQFDMNSQEDGNRRLNMLSIISAVFLPTTFLAGFWGMNFSNMPLLDNPNGFILSCVLMLIIPIWLLIYFYRHGWFK